MILLAGKIILLLHTVLMEDKEDFTYVKITFLSYCPVAVTLICMCAN